MSYTDEQLKYINYDKKSHTKLLACAGSGKTRCIIARINNLIEKKIYLPDEILMLTFSRFTRDDFLNKIKSYSNDEKRKSPIIPNTSVKTIDSFAKTIIDPNGDIDVSLLSFKLMKYLETESESNLKKNDNLNKIKMVFIDEAQDLNEIQYNIFSHLKDKLGIVVNMVGDPNQNIYQFRESSDKYLTQFDGVVFKLTKNFRSHLPIVNFSKHLRPFNEYDIICSKSDNGCKPIMMFYEDEKILEENIIDLLNSAKEHDIDLSEFAILAPTRGRMRGGGKSHGLCFVSNLLYKAGINFKQFYEESSEEVSGDGIKYAPIKNHVNILTYMGSKGLEWNYVILIDADACLINKRSFSQEKHNNDRYLLYVACSRAIHNMYIFSRCYFRNGEPIFSTNPWFRQIPSELYHIDDRFNSSFVFPELKYVDHKEHDNRLSKLIDRLNCYDLDELSNLIKFQNKKPIYQKKIFNKDYSQIEKQSGLFLSRFTENLFYSLYNIKTKNKQIKFKEIDNIIETENIVSGVSDETTKWYYSNRSKYTWDKFNKDNNISPNVKQEITALFNKSKPFDSFTIAIDGYYQLFILNQKKWIKNIYIKYLNCQNPSQIRELLFNIIVILHAIDTQHYFHIKSKGSKYSNILTDFKDLFDEIEQYVDNFDHVFVNSNEGISRWNIVTKLDLLDSKDNIWSLKCTSDISLKNMIHSVVSALIHNTELIDDEFNIAGLIAGLTDSDIKDNNKKKKSLKTVKNVLTKSINVNFINILKGEELSYSIDIDKEIVKKIITLLTK